MARSGVTIRDVAKEAGVSHQTVSRVINANKRVNPDTRQRVKAAIEKLGYRPNAIARFMAQGRTKTLACISPNISDYTFSKIIEGAEAEARQHGYFLISGSAPNEVEFKDLIDELVESGRTEGLLIINPYQDQRHALTPEKFPMVYVGTTARDNDVYSVSLNDEAGGIDATRHLLDAGHQKIAMIAGPNIEDCTRNRNSGYRKALQAAGLPIDESLIVSGDWSASSGYDAIQSLLKQGAQFTAVFAQNDRMAAGAARALREAGLQVPEDISLIGFDDMPLASYFHPPLTTMRQDMLLIGREAVQVLIRLLEKKPVTQYHKLISAELVPRESTSTYEIR
jgi:DNA-binding LacI/PurR family transcriptional regulator